MGYHHELHKRRLKKAAILKLQTEIGLIEGHNECAKYLTAKVEEPLTNPVDLDIAAQESLLNEIELVFTDDDNARILEPPDKQYILETINKSNINAAPGSDGIPTLFYKECWDIVGDTLA